MTTAIKRRRGTTAQHSSFTGLEGELTVDTSKKTVVVHDGVTAGGFALAKEDNPTFSGSATLSSGTANGVAYLNGSKVLTTGSALTFDGTNLSVGTVQAASGDLTVKAAAGNLLYNAIGNIHAWYNNSSEQMRLTSTGLGIGTSSPAYKLQSNGGSSTNNNTANTIVATGTEHVRLKINTPTTGGYRASLVLSSDEAVTGTSKEVTISTFGSSEMQFATGGSERMRIDSSGNVGIGTSSPSTKLDVTGGTGSATSYNTLYLRGGVNGSTGSGAKMWLGAGSAVGNRGVILEGVCTNADNAHAMVFYTSASAADPTERMRIDSSGNLQVSNLAGTGNRAVYSTSTGVLTNSSSDGSLKENDTPISQGLDAVLAMRPISYEWIDKEKMGAQREIGFIAQEMQQIVPEVVGSNSDETLSIDYPKLVAVMAKAIQELTARVVALEAK